MQIVLDIDWYCEKKKPVKLWWDPNSKWIPGPHYGHPTDYDVEGMIVARLESETFEFGQYTVHVRSIEAIDG